MEKFNLDIPKIGYFILYRNNGDFLGNKIQAAQKEKGLSDDASQFTHIETSLGGTYCVRTAPPKVKPAEITKLYKGRFIRIVRFKADDYAIKRYKVAIWSATLCNLDYDWFGVFRFKLRFLFNLKNSFFCSENCLFSLQKEYPGALGMRPEDCMPAHFANPALFETVWEGVIE